MCVTLRTEIFRSINALSDLAYAKAKEFAARIHPGVIEDDSNTDTEDAVEKEEVKTSREEDTSDVDPATMPNKTAHRIKRDGPGQAGQASIFRDLSAWSQNGPFSNFFPARFDYDMGKNVADGLSSWSPFKAISIPFTTVRISIGQ